jgi:hypothetical protein
MSTKKQKMCRLHVVLPAPVMGALRSYAARNGVNLTESIRRAISLQKFLSDHTELGGKILIEKPDGRILEIVTSI